MEGALGPDEVGKGACEGISGMGRAEIGIGEISMRGDFVVG